MSLRAKELAQLHAIERDLSTYDPGLAGKFAAFSESSGRRSAPRPAPPAKPERGSPAGTACFIAILGLQFGLVVAAGGFVMGRFALGLAGLTVMVAVIAVVIERCALRRRQADRSSARLDQQAATPR